MKFITIYQEGSSPIHFSDKDDRDNIEYAQDLSAIMSLSKITLVHTTDSSLIVRPHKITAIQIYDEQEDEDKLPKEQPEMKEETKDREEQVDEKKDEEPVDFLTDM